MHNCTLGGGRTAGALDTQRSVTGGHPAAPGKLQREGGATVPRAQGPRRVLETRAGAEHERGPAPFSKAALT